MDADMKRFTVLLQGSMLAPGFAGACLSAGDDGADEPKLPEGCDALVEPGVEAFTELLGALMDAQPGETVCMSEGTFDFVDELSIDLGQRRDVEGCGARQDDPRFSGQTIGATGSRSAATEAATITGADGAGDSNT